MQAVYDGLANAQPQTGALRKAVFFVKAFEVVIPDANE